LKESEGWNEINIYSKYNCTNPFWEFLKLKFTMNYLTQVVCEMTSGIIYKFNSEEGDKHGYCTQF
jgi:hypothetical protein